MKANEAPKKIYLFENPINNEPDDRWLSKRSCDEDVEYTRTDVFMERACKWIYDKFPTVSGITQLMVVEDFKKYMEKE